MMTNVNGIILSVCACFLFLMKTMAIIITVVKVTKSNAKSTDSTIAKMIEVVY